MKKFILIAVFCILLASCAERYVYFTGKVIKKEVVKLETAFHSFQYNVSYIQIGSQVYQTTTDTVYFLYNEGDNIRLSCLDAHGDLVHKLIYLDDNNKQSISLSY